MPNKLSHYIKGIVDFYSEKLPPGKQIKLSYWGARFRLLWIFDKRTGRADTGLLNHYMQEVVGRDIRPYDREAYEAEFKKRIGGDDGQTYKDFIMALGGRGSQTLENRTPRVRRIMGILERRLRRCSTTTASTT